MVEEKEINKGKEWPDGAHIEVTAIPRDKWEFVRWRGDLGGYNNPDTILMNKNKTITAYFGTQNDKPYNKIESRLFADVVNDGRVFRIGMRLLNKLPEAITLYRITLLSHEGKTIIDRGREKLLPPNTYVSYETAWLTYHPALDEFEKYRIYWEVQLDRSSNNTIKIGYPTSPSKIKLKTTDESHIPKVGTKPQIKDWGKIVSN